MKQNYIPGCYAITVKGTLNKNDVEENYDDDDEGDEENSHY